jgi:hypothetical protein
MEQSLIAAKVRQADASLARPRRAGKGWPAADI